MGTKGRRDRALAALMAVVGVLVAVIVGQAWWGWQRTRPERWIRTLASDPEIRRQAVAQIVAETSGIHDSHPDAEVGRGLIAGIEGRELAGATCDTNAFGLREDEFAWEKPPGTLRVVLLGDSYVFGWGVEADERLGAELERLLAAEGVAAECLHLGVVSWNFVAEAAFLRRQLAVLQPDLVVQVAISNDLEDCSGVRGFGVPGFFSPHVRERANGLVANRVRLDDWPLTFQAMWKELRQPGMPMLDWRVRTPLDDPPLLQALDFESRSRFEDAARRLRELAELIEQQGGRYLLLARWDDATIDVLRQRLLEPVGLERCAFLPPRLADEPGLWISAEDPHWNADGHALAARVVHALARERGLLPGAGELDPLEGEAELLAAIAERLAASADPALAERRAERVLRASLAFGAPEPEVAAQVYGGLTEEGEVAPYASLVLRNAGGPVVVEGEPLQRPELRGRSARVFLDELERGTIDLSPGPPFALRLELPPELAGRSHLAVRFVAEDYVYDDLPTTRCTAFRLTRVASLGGE